MMASPFPDALAMMLARIRLLTFAAVLLTALGVTAPASAQTCADNIIDDWADNAQIDGTYPIECYRAAIQALPEDLRAYSSAGDDIRRAQQELIAAQSGSGGEGESQGGGGGGGSQGGDDGSSGETAERDPQGETQAQDTLSGVTESESPPAREDAGDETDSEATAAPDAEAFGEELGDGGSSLPVPIIVLLAVAGVAAISVAGWLIVRQLRSRGG